MYYAASDQYGYVKLAISDGTSAGSVIENSAMQFDKHTFGASGGGICFKKKYLFFDALKNLYSNDVIEY